MSRETLAVATSFDPQELRRLSLGPIENSGARASIQLAQFGHNFLDTNSSSHGFPMRGMEQTQERLLQIVRIADHAQKASLYCSQIGITPLAVVPTSAWEKMCAQANLFTVCPTKNSMVTVSLKRLHDQIQIAKSTPAPTPSFWSIIPLIFSTPDPQKERVDNTLWQLGQEETVVRKYFTKEAWHDTLRDLLPENKEPADSGYKTKILFPSPPTDVALVIQRLTGKVKIMVTLESGAIYFPDLEMELLNDIEKAKKKVAEQYDAYLKSLEEQRNLKIKKLNQVDPLLEPIITFGVGEVTVIAAQYGEWAIEQCVMERCIEESLFV